MNRSKQIQTIAARLKHNKEAQEAYRVILSEKYNKGETQSTTYKQIQKLYDRAENNVHHLTIDLSLLDARMNRAGEVEIY
jgi:hypothetical protein